MPTPLAQAPRRQWHGHLLPPNGAESKTENRLRNSVPFCQRRSRTPAPRAGLQSRPGVRGRRPRQEGRVRRRLRPGHRRTCSRGPRTRAVCVAVTSVMKDASSPTHRARAVDSPGRARGWRWPRVPAATRTGPCPSRSGSPPSCGRAAPRAIWGLSVPSQQDLRSAARKGYRFRE